MTLRLARTDPSEDRVHQVPVLLATYYFPPHGGAGTQRFARFARDLPSCGYRPVVLCAAAHPDAQAPDLDPSLSRGLPEDLVVRRIPASAPRTGGWRRLIDLQVDEEDWVRRALPAAIALAEQQHVQAIVTTVSPYALAGLGRAVSNRLRIPWVLDLRDPWALDGWRAYSTRWHARRELRLMRRALADADIVIANTPSAARAYAQLAPAARMTVIPNGFDADDFPSAAPPDRLGPMRIVHVGTLHDPMPEAPRRRVCWREIDRTARSGRTLIEAIALLRERDPEFADRIRIELVGRVHPNHAALARACQVEDLIQTTGYVSHAIAMQRLARADACFVPLHGVAPGERALVVPGKLYEAVASGRPVLACLPPGDGADLVRATNAGLVFDPKNAAALARAMAILARAKQRGIAEHGADITKLTAFTRRAAAHHLARTLDAARNPLLPVPMDDPWSMLRTAPSPHAERRAA